MSIMTMEMRGVRGLRGPIAAQAAANQLAIRQAQGELRPALTDALFIGQDSGAVTGGDFISTYGVPIGAGVAGLAVGLVIAKLARRRK